ncbi:cation:proton antiporter regulatory subunit [Lentzea albidocapillata]|uniref:cation:proton antiporter regulatory subunit n=1 Tax=Lentzea albidocapillata TaxID=40571 RepID=UPI00068ABE55|nr:TrkA C-terminal domain-containing protein [Lentzea albidocapillata]
MPGLDSDQIDVPTASAHAVQPLGHTCGRSRAGASIVAIVRSEQVIALPPPAEVFKAGDVLVVIGIGRASTACARSSRR